MSDPAQDDERGPTSDATRPDRPDRRSSSKLGREPDFGARYRLLGAIGKGGMGEVYRAYDTELKGEVALKIVRDDADAALARFRREIALARKVTSPNVLRVYDLAEHDGLRFLSMEYVDGEDLAALIRREKKLPLERALAIFRQVCIGLAAAHEQGVVHRDLKPQNVLVDKEGKVRVADFGLARSIGESGLTASGAVLGSPAYMSPEQVKGDEVDERSDIYSLGIMLYQLVSGEPPFQGASPHSVMEMRLHKRPKPLRQLADVPAHVEAVCARCLELDPAKRYTTIHELLTELEPDGAAPAPRRRSRRVVIAGACTAIAIAVGTIVWLRNPVSEPSPPAPAKPTAPAPTSPFVTVLVLDIENRTSEPLLDAVETIVERSIRRSRRLDPFVGAQLHALASEVAAESLPVERFAQKLAERDHRRIVSVRGSVVAKGNGFVISLVATDAITGADVFVQAFDAPSLVRVPPVTGRLVSGLRAALGEEVPADEVEKTGLSPSLDADHEYAIGTALLMAGNNRGALPHFLQAVVQDPEFAAAHVYLAFVYSNLARPSEADEQFGEVIKHIDQLGERDRLMAMASYYNLSSGEIDRAIASCQELLGKWPGDLLAEICLAEAYRWRRDIDKALEVGERAAREHHGNVIARSNLAAYEIEAGAFTRAIDELHEIAAEFPQIEPSNYLAIAELLAGHVSEANDAYAKLAAADPSNGVTANADRALAEARPSDAIAILQPAIADDRKHDLADAAELKEVLLAEALLRRGDKVGARAAAAKVATEPPNLLTAAIVQLAVGDERLALATAAKLGDQLALEPRAFAKLIQGEDARLHGRPEQAIATIRDGLRIDDVWMGHLLLARAELDAKKLGDAATELRTCLARRGESALHFDDTPGVRYIPQVTYYLARAQEGLGSPQAAASYAAFVAMQPHAEHDALVDDARKRAPR